MKIEKCKKESFVVIGKEGATTDGAGFIQKLWDDANSHFGEVSQAPDGWTKWVIPGYEYIYVERENDNVFLEVIQYLQEHGISLVGAVHDFTCPQTGKGYMFFPIKKL